MAADRPVALVFARNAPGALGMLLKRLDEAVDRHKAVEFRTIAVFLTEDRAATEAKLEKLAQEAKLSDNVPLVIPEKSETVKPYKVHKDAEVTVVLYSNFKILGNFAFKAGEMQEKDVAAIMAEVPKIVPTKEGWDRQVQAKKEAMERWQKEELKKKEELKRQEELKKKEEFKKKTEAAAKEKA